ncbi:MAG: MarR family transcriptional regulator [Flavobacteriales bacterium]|nr:MarR family transcriptional regulator [Flavobacteriales bacterium]MCB9190494.1 MarR family transcriptional regulator [Flavobacteriales bacterium]
MRKGIFPGMEEMMMPWIGKTMKHIDLFIATRMAEHGVNLTRQQVILLKILFHDGPLPQNNLAFLTDRDKTSLTRLLATMEKKNLVARITSAEDKRVNMVHLTKHGEKVLQEIAPVLLQTMMFMQEGISEEDQRVVIQTMKKIQENIEKHDIGCSNN